MTSTRKEKTSPGAEPPSNRAEAPANPKEGKSMVTQRLLSVDEAGELLGTTARFPRRLIAERRIEFVRVGRHVRIPEHALAEYVAARTVQPISTRRGRRAA